MAEPTYNLVKVRQEEREAQKQATISTPDGLVFNITHQPLPHKCVNKSLYRAVMRQTFRNQNNQSKIKQATRLYFERAVCDPKPAVPVIPAIPTIPAIPAIPAVPGFIRTSAIPAVPAVAAIAVVLAIHNHPHRLLYQTYNAQLLAGRKLTLSRQLVSNISPAMTLKAEIAQVLGDFLGIKLVIIHQEGACREVVC